MQHVENTVYRRQKPEASTYFDLKRSIPYLLRCDLTSLKLAYSIVQEIQFEEIKTPQN